MGTALAQLPAAQLLDRLERTALGSWDDRLAWLFSWWLKRDPEAAAEWIKPRLALAAQDGPLGWSFERSPRGQLILGWAKADPNRALDYEREHPGSGLAGQLLKVVIKSLPESDERARLALLLDFPVGTRAGAMEVLLRDSTRREPSAALAAAQALADEGERQWGAAEVLRTWGDKDPVTAFEQFQALALDQRDVLEVLVRGLVKVAPERAVAWLQSLDGAQFGRWGPNVVERWAERDLAAALGFSLEHGISVGLRHESGRSRLLHDSLSRSSRGSHPEAIRSAGQWRNTQRGRSRGYAASRRVRSASTLRHWLLWRRKT